MKDPAALLYIDNWLTSTAEMDADVRGWYLNLILHQYDKKDLPDDIEKLAVLANVKFSEFERFKQVFEQVFKQKFKQNTNGRLENSTATDILRKRESFKDKRSESGKMSYFVRYITKRHKLKKAELQFIKDNVDLSDVDLKSEQVLEQVFKQVFELYINGDGDINSSSNTINKERDNLKLPFESDDFHYKWVQLINAPKWKKKRLETLENILKKLSTYECEFACELLDTAFNGDYQGVTFPDTNIKYQEWLNAKNRQQTNTKSSSGTREDRQQELAKFVAEKVNSSDKE